MAEPSRPARIWYQSFVHPAEQAPYIERLQAFLDKAAGARRRDSKFTASIRPTGIFMR